MYYKCINHECGWEGEEKDTLPFLLSTVRRCPKCQEIVDAIGNWSCTPPGEPGWYWHRNDDNDNIPEAVEIRKDTETVYSKKEILWCIFPTDFDSWLYYRCEEGHCMKLSDVKGEWSERIEPPE
jgi:hypothetical protein